MAKRKPVRLGDLQLRIMQVLWENDAPLTVASVRESLDGPSLAYTTIATMLRKMEARGLISHREAGRKYLYEARIMPDDVSPGVSRDLVDRLFAGSLADTVSHLLQTRDVNAKELDELERLIQEHKRTVRRKRR